MEVFYKPWLAFKLSHRGLHMNLCSIWTCTPVSLFLSLSLTCPLPFLPSVSCTHTHTQRDTRGSVDAALSALRWGVLLLTAVWIEAAVHPLLSGCCRAAGLAFVLHSIMARHNYSLSRDGTQAASTFALASLHLAEQHRHTQAHTFFMCTQVNVSVRYMCHCYKNRFPCPCWFWHILKVLLHLEALNHK